MLSVVYFRLTGSLRLMLLTTVGQWLGEAPSALCVLRTMTPQNGKPQRHGTGVDVTFMKVHRLRYLYFVQFPFSSFPSLTISAYEAEPEHRQNTALNPSSPHT